MRETNESKAGMELAMIYPIAVTPKVQDNQTIQCVGVLLFRWREPRRILTKMYFAGILKREKKVREVETKRREGDLTCVTIVVVTTNPGNAKP